METSDLQRRVEAVFTEHFGRTPLKQRLDDFLKEAIELSRFTDLRDLKEEAGDALSSLLMLLNENGWTAEEVVEATLEKIERRRHQYATLGRKTQVAILGGSFDPVTQGHLNVARFILRVSRTFDEVWFMPAYQHLEKELASVEHRLAMLRLATARHPQIKVFEYEIENQFRGETYHLVKQLLEEDYARDQYDFSIAIGQDVANSLPNWPNSDLLMNQVRFVVAARPGYDLDPTSMWYMKRPHVYVTPDRPLPPISSTDARRAAAAGDDEALAKVVPPDVLGYIREHGLYAG